MAVVRTGVGQASMVRLPAAIAHSEGVATGLRDLASIAVLAPTRSCRPSRSQEGGNTGRALTRTNGRSATFEATAVCLASGTWRSRQVQFVGEVGSASPRRPPALCSVAAMTTITCRIISSDKPVQYVTPACRDVYSPVDRIGVERLGADDTDGTRGR